MTDYVPDPFALQITAFVLSRRAQSLDLMQVAREDVQRAGALLLTTSKLLASETGQGTPFNPESDEVPTESEVVLRTSGFVLLQQKIERPTIGMELRHYRLVEESDMAHSRTASTARDARSAAVFEVIQHPSLTWEVLQVDVLATRRREGLASLLYNWFEQDSGSALRPSGWLSDDAYALWLTRNPELIKWHRQDDMCGGLWASPKQLLNMQYAYARQLDQSR